uniref:Uncharacterized protein n=1 Tax=Aegilops tauschii subsp. strangulata TaxID=200361 RepID=A0A453AHM9_AEGTS
HSQAEELARHFTASLFTYLIPSSRREEPNVLRHLTMDTADATVQGTGAGGRVLLLPFPGMQGHANPMLQLGR